VRKYVAAFLVLTVLSCAKQQGSTLEGEAADVAREVTALVAASYCADLTVVDGSDLFCRSLRQRFPAVNVQCSLFEQFHPDCQFDTVILSHVLEHVASPTTLLQSVRAWLSPHGAVYAAVPNARSIHRQAAVLMRALPNEHSLNETDIHHGHRRVYGPESFRNEFVAAGLTIRLFGGYWLKPLSNAQIDASWTPDMLEAFMRLGERYPDIAAEIYVVATS